MTHALHSSEEMGWQTPGWVLDLVRQVAPIALDPCTTFDNPTGAKRYLPELYSYNGVPDDDGLVEDWSTYADGLVFVNPPYGPHLSGPIESTYKHRKKDKTTGGLKLVGIGRGWAEKIAQEMEAGLEVLALVPTRTETAWWRRLFWVSDSVCLGPRIPFIHPKTGKVGAQPNHASTFFYSGPHEGRFVRTFEKVGILLSPALCEGICP